MPIAHPKRPPRSAARTRCARQRSAPLTPPNRIPGQPDARAKKSNPNGPISMPTSDNCASPAMPRKPTRRGTVTSRADQRSTLPRSQGHPAGIPMLPRPIMVPIQALHGKTSSPQSAGLPRPDWRAERTDGVPIPPSHPGPGPQTLEPVIPGACPWRAAPIWASGRSSFRVAGWAGGGAFAPLPRRTLRDSCV